MLALMLFEPSRDFLDRVDYCADFNKMKKAPKALSKEVVAFLVDVAIDEGLLAMWQKTLESRLQLPDDHIYNM
jgi:hypothetical protein